MPHEGYHRQYGSFASNSPTTDGERVYASFGSRGVYAYDMDGRPVWQKDFGLQMRMFTAFGEGVGPVLDDGRLILLFDHEGEGFLTMLDAATGRELWRTPRTEGTNWAAPLVVTHDGRKQIVVNSPRKVRGYDYETGKPDLGNRRPRTEHHPASGAAPGLVLVMSGFRNPALMAIRLGREGDLAGTDAIVWTTNRGLSYSASPVLHEGRLYFITDTGMVSGSTRRPVSRSTSRCGCPSRTTSRRRRSCAGGNLYFPTEEGDVGRGEGGTDTGHRGDEHADRTVVHRVASGRGRGHVPQEPDTPVPDHWSAN